MRAPDSPATHWTATDWGPYVHDVRLDGRRLRYLDYGSGPPLVLIHGLGGCWQWWLEVAPELSREHRVIAVDLPGFGHSEPLPAPCEMARHADAVAQLVDRLGLDSVTPVGHSMGGLVSLALAERHPQRVARVILVNAGGVPMSPARLAAVVRWLTLFHKLLSRPATLNALATRPRLRRALLKGGMGDPSCLSPQLAAEIIPLMAAPGFLDAVVMAARAVAATQHDAIAHPVHLIWGDRDPIVPLSRAHAMQRALPGARLTVLEGIGHCPMVEAPARFSRAVLAAARETPAGVGVGASAGVGA